MELRNHKIINDTSHPFLIRTASKRQILLLLLWMETILFGFVVLFIQTKQRYFEQPCVIYLITAGPRHCRRRCIFTINFYYFKQICSLLMVYLSSPLIGI